MTTSTVPDAYLGVWKRTLLRTPDFEDTTSEVYWLQTSRWHGDIRVRTDRPALADRGSLAACARDELLALAKHQGFCGVTTVEGDVCRWHRRVDFQPPSGFNDVGRMVFESPDRSLEYGIEQDYFEIWERLPQSIGPTMAVTRDDAGRAVHLLRTGHCVMRIRPRAQTLPPAANLAALAVDCDDATLRDWLDFEISFARLDDDGSATILRSTFPWLEGQRLPEAEVLQAAADGGLGPAARHWRVLD